MNRCLSYALSVFLVLSLCADASAEVGPGLSGRVALGYVFIDDHGNMSTTREVFDVPSGFTLQNLSLKGFFKENSSFELDLFDINQDGRSFFFSLRRPGLLSLSSRFKQTESVFDQEGSIISKRTSYNIAGQVQPAKFLKLRSDFSRYRREGERRNCCDNPAVGSGEFDQFFWSSGFGGQLKYGKSFLDLEYRLRSIDDEKDELLDRDGSRIRTSLNTPLPRNVYLSLQYFHDDSELKSSALKLTSDLYTGSLLHQPTEQMDLSARFLHRRTENQSTEIISEISRGAGQVSYRIHRGYRLALGYEYEKREDEAQGNADEARTVTNSYLAGVDAQFMPDLSLKARYVFQDREDDDKATLTGPYDDERVLIQVRSRPIRQVNLGLRYEDKRRDNPDISSCVKDKGFVASVSVGIRKWLGFHLNYSLLDVKYDNTEGTFESDNNAFTSQVDLEPLENLSLTGGWNHVDIAGDLDIRKEGISLGFRYVFIKDYTFEGKYEAYDYDDYLNYPDYYAANVYTISLVRKFGGI